MFNIIYLTVGFQLWTSKQDC